MSRRLRLATALLTFFVVSCAGLFTSQTPPDIGPGEVRLKVNGRAYQIPVMFIVDGRTNVLDIEVHRGDMEPYTVSVYKGTDGWYADRHFLTTYNKVGAILIDPDNHAAKGVSIYEAVRLHSIMRDTRSYPVHGDDRLTSDGTGLRLIVMKMDRAINDYNVDTASLFSIGMDGLNLAPEQPARTFTVPAGGMPPTGAVDLSDPESTLGMNRSVRVPDKKLVTAAANGQLDTVMELINTTSTSINQVDKATGNDSLMYAIMNGHTDVATFLIDRGISLSHQNNRGLTSLMIASWLGNYDVADALVAGGADVKAVDHQRNSVLMFAASSVNPYTIERLIRQGAMIDRTNLAGDSPLIHAARSGHTRNLELLVLAGANLDMANNAGQTALAVAVHADHVRAAESLLNAGADPDVADIDGRTPLMLATMDGNIPMAQLLLDHGASVTKPDDRGNSPLIIAAAYDRPYVASLLLGKGANIETKNNEGATALDIARASGAGAVTDMIVKIMQEQNRANADLFAATANDRIDEMDRLLKAGANAETRDVATGNTPIFNAVLNDNAAAVQLLVENGADINAQNEAGNTPLMVATLDGTNRMVRTLLAMQADPDIANSEGDTPLIWAARTGMEEKVRLLVLGGADVNVRNNDGISPYNAASAAGHESIVKFLAASGAWENQ